MAGRLCQTSFGHMSIVGRQPGQCLCAWCGGGLLSDTPCLTEQERGVVRAFASAHGVRWKRKFLVSDVQEVRWILDVRGKKWLNWFTWSRIDKIDERVELYARLERKRKSRNL